MRKAASRRGSGQDKHLRCGYLVVHSRNPGLVHWCSPQLYVDNRPKLLALLKYLGWTKPLPIPRVNLSTVSFSPRFFFFKRGLELIPRPGVLFFLVGIRILRQSHTICRGLTQNPARCACWTKKWEGKGLGLILLERYHRELQAILLYII